MPNEKITVSTPYNRSKIKKDIEQYSDLASLREAIYRDISETFNNSIEINNVHTVSDWCRANDTRLICGRFSRAFYIDGMLMASAKVIESISIHIPIQKIVAFLKQNRDFCSIETYLGSDTQSLINLNSKRKVSLAEINGILTRLKKSLQSYESKTTSVLESKHGLNHDQFAIEYNKLISITLKLRQLVTNLEKSIQKAPQYNPAFLVYFQRITNTGSINIGMLNEKKDPFFGQDEHILQLLETSAPNSYITPHLNTWLQKCDDWIEALPAYASYKITPKTEGGYDITAQVQRASLEEMYRRHADDWAINIEEVMLIENVEVARRLLISNWDKLSHSQIVNKIKKHNLSNRIVWISELVEDISKKHVKTIGYEIEKGSSRLEALWLIAQNDSRLIKKINNHKTKPSNNSIYYNHVFDKVRPLPCIHVLTTLGPGETEVNVENWLQETMALFNVIRAFNLQGKVADIIKGYKKTIIDSANAVIKELELEGTLLNLIRDEGLNASLEQDLNKCVIKLLMSYPEVAKATAKALSIETKDLYRQLDNTMATISARREVIAAEGLSSLLMDPLYRYEASGPYKRYNLLYTPSRVDLGIEEVYSVQGIPKWLGGRDQAASIRGKELYSLYNANPQAVNSPRLAEFMKVGENFFTRGGVYYLSLAAGANIDAVGIGDFEFFRDQWNMREDRLVLPTGETYGGFCVPKEFTLLYAVTLAAVDKDTSAKILTSFNIPTAIQPSLVDDMRKILARRIEFDSILDWEDACQKYLTEKYKEYFTTENGCFYLPNPFALANTFSKANVISTTSEKETNETLRLTNWINKKAQGLEEINRIGPFRKVQLIRNLLNKSRQRNPNIPDDPQLIGVMTASYKEGALNKDGLEIPITDVRFSAGARKLEIYSGTYEKNLLKDIDPEGREVLRNMFRDFKTVSDIRFVGTCTGSDILNYVPGSGLEDLKEQINQKLIDVGLNQSQIDANCRVYGGDLKNWTGIQELADSVKSALLSEIGPNIHLLVTDRRGTFATYDEAVQGVDFIDLGIPDPGLLDLIDNFPKLCALMRFGRPNSALVFADGTSGGRRRTFSFRYASSRRKVKELFACEPNAVYGSLGLGQETVDQWRQEMELEKNLCDELFASITNKNHTKSRALLNKIVTSAKLYDKALQATTEEKKARDNGVWKPIDRYISRAYGRLVSEYRLEDIDFGAWLILGGSYVVNGKITNEELVNIRKSFEKSIPRKGSRSEFNESEINEIISSLFRPVFKINISDEYKEIKTGIGGSLKAVEEKTSRLEKLNERRKMTRRVLGIQQRKIAFQSSNLCNTEHNIQLIYKQAIAKLSIKELNDNTQLGILMFHLYKSLEIIISELSDSPAKTNLTDAINNLISSYELTPEQYTHLAKVLAKSAEQFKTNSDLSEIAYTFELLDIAFLLEKMLCTDTPEEKMLEVARFFDLTINNHIFDYLPYHYHTERGTAFKHYSRTELFSLSVSHHQWLYQHIQYILSEESPLKTTSEAYRNQWIGDILNNHSPLGVKLENPNEQFWFSYARLRDVAVLMHEGIPLPILINNLPPSYINKPERINVAIIYPHGNTTVPVALQQGSKLSRLDNINLMLSAFPEMKENKGQASLDLHDSFMFVSKEDFNEIKNAGLVDSTLNRNIPIAEDNILVMVQFSNPLPPDAIFFHFTHYLRLKVDALDIPVIQPFLWEAATHLKCRLPDMLKGSSARTADQANWLQKDTLKMKTEKAISEIKKQITKLAKNHDALIVKSEKESGGRSAMILPVRKNNSLINENLDILSRHIYEISKVDNVVIQEVLKSHVRKLYSQDFLHDMINRFIKIGIPVNLLNEPRTPLFSYFRLIVVKGKENYRITHRITVLSTQGVANVGQGGLLYEYRDEFINPIYRDALWREMQKACFCSINSQSQYLEKHGSQILDEYLQSHPEFGDTINIERELQITDIPYEMGDYMPVFMTNVNDELVSYYDEASEIIRPLFEKGKPVIQLFNKSGKTVRPPFICKDQNNQPVDYFDKKGNQISPLVVFKIEPNPGAGLWRPHDDQLPVERKGEGVYLIFKSLGERAREYRKSQQR